MPMRKVGDGTRWGTLVACYPKFDKIGSDLARFLGPTRVRSMG